MPDTSAASSGAATSAPPTLRGRARIAIVGNCQARPLGAVLALLSPELEIIEPVIVHLAKPADEAKANERLAGADIVLAQLVADNYPVPFVRLNALRERLGDKVVPWVNLYWRGRNPELVYKRELAGRAEFPLVSYHLEPVHEGWRDGLDAAEIAARLADPDLARLRYGGTAEASLAELRSREAGTPVPITDVIEERAATDDLFHVFNHPTTDLLGEYARRLLRALGLPCGRVLRGAGWEPLGAYGLPPSPASALPPWPARTYRVPRRPGPFRLMTEVEIVEGYLAAYDVAHGEGGKGGAGTGGA